MKRGYIMASNAAIDDVHMQKALGLFIAKGTFYREEPTAPGGVKIYLTHPDFEYSDEWLRYDVIFHSCNNGEQAICRLDHEGKAIKHYPFTCSCYYGGCD